MTTSLSRQTSPATEQLGRRPALDGLRGVAVLIVVGVHVDLLAGGYIGVDVFFALSGFLITTLLCEEWERTGSISVPRFYARRARRLAPALLLLVAAFAAVILAVHPFSGLWPLGQLVPATLLGVNNWVTALVPPHGQVLGALVPTWTLAEEMQFYLLWPVLLWLLLRRRATPGAILALLGVTVLALLGLGELMRHAYPAYNAYTSPLDRGAELLLGSAGAISWRERLLPPLLRSRPVGWIAAGLLAVTAFHAATPHRWWYLTSALLTAVLIVNLLGRPAGSSGSASPLDVRRILDSWPLRYTGQVSYGIYLYHLPVYYLLWTYASGRTDYFYAPIVLAASFAAAALSWRLIELPILRHRRRAAVSDGGGDVPVRRQTLASAPG